MSKNERKLFFFLAGITIGYYSRLVHWSGIILTYGLPYYCFFFGRKIYPIIFFLFFLIYRNFPKHKHKINMICKIGVILCIALFIWLLIGWSSGVDFYAYTGVKWSYIATVEWTGAILLTTLFLFSSTNDLIYSFTFSGISMSAAGMLYELPLYPKIKHLKIYYDRTFPLIIATNWLSLLFMIYMLKTKNWKPTKLWLAAFLQFLIFSLLYNLNPKIFPGYLPRLPTIFMILNFSDGIMEKRVHIKKGRVIKVF